MKDKDFNSEIVVLPDSTKGNIEIWEVVLLLLIKTSLVLLFN